jgi:hypothetical protein
MFKKKIEKINLWCFHYYNFIETMPKHLKKFRHCPYPRNLIRNSYKEYQKEMAQMKNAVITQQVVHNILSTDVPALLAAKRATANLARAAEAFGTAQAMVANAASDLSETLTDPQNWTQGSAQVAEQVQV